MELRKSELAGVYNILKEAGKVKEVASSLNFTESYIRQMFQGKRTITETVWNRALEVTDQYLKNIESGSNKAKELIKKYQSIKTDY